MPPISTKQTQNTHDIWCGNPGPQAWDRHKNHLFSKHSFKVISYPIFLNFSPLKSIKIKVYFNLFIYFFRTFIYNHF
jgi:hypothetical protein